MFLDKEKVTQFYTALPQKVARARQTLNRPLTYAEKVLLAHMKEVDPTQQKGKTTARLYPDRVAMQDATAQMAILQFMLTGKKQVAVPTTVHCDHLIRAQAGAEKDLEQANQENNEVYQFLKSAANKYNMGFWKPGAGIIHQVVLENYAIPGNLIIGTDSHTPNGGGLGMVAIGVGGADAVDAMAGEPFTVTLPKLIGVKLTGQLNGWAAPKDVILKLAGILTVKGGTGHIVEYFGPGTASISCTGKATITNMGAEIGATTSIFPYDDAMSRYLHATQRGFVAELANQCKQDLQADPEVLANPQQFFDQVIEIDLNTLEPHVVGPHTPDLARPISQLRQEVEEKGYPEKIEYALIGSCTNSSYEDLTKAVDVARQALAAGIKPQSGFMVTPGSEQIHETIKRDGIMKTFEDAGAVVLANACGPCIGQWKRADAMDKPNSILTSYNRNFKKRNDGNPKTHAFIASPELVTAMAFAGTLRFNPVADTIKTQGGHSLTFKPPLGSELPANGFVTAITGFDAPTGVGDVVVNPTSERLQLLTPFAKWNIETDFQNCKVLVKAQGKCTTDHISPAGPWLRYRGHLDNISNNMYSGAVNAFTQEVGQGKNQLTNETGSFTKVARAYKEKNVGWIVVGDENYGEGSSREHAAMEPRHLGCRAVIAKSFARIAETNLKKQGVLALQFVNPNDYQRIREDDTIAFPNLHVQTGQTITIELQHTDGSAETIQTTHTCNSEQVRWFYAGSAINYFREKEQQY